MRGDEKPAEKKSLLRDTSTLSYSGPSVAVCKATFLNAKGEGKRKSRRMQDQEQHEFLYGSGFA